MPDTTEAGPDGLDRRFRPFAEQIEREGLPPLLVDTFRHYYTELVQGNTGMIGESEIEPVTGLPDAERLDENQAASGRAALPRAIIIKLNGGLGTSMGLDRAKSLLPAKAGLSFLDIIARQTLNLRRNSGAAVPLLFMNSFNTHADTLAALERYPDLATGVPLTFVQHKVPKVLQDGFGAVDAGQRPELAWCPPGHGDIYTALQTSGLLAGLLDQGFEYAFVSNADNLGAVLDLKILSYFAANRLPFLMEVADRTPADSKGGHLARRRRDARLILREVAQCPPEAMPAFGNIEYYTYFNTNNLWLHLPSLQAALDRNGNVLKLPLIRNSKTLDPRDPASPKVYQLETAMGAAIEIFEGAGALRVPRSRFAPVKLTSDLLVLWSDAYTLTPDSRVILNPSNTYGLPIVQLDNRFYKFINQLEERFPHGAPSLTGCEILHINGDFVFGKDVVVKDRVNLTNSGPQPQFIPDGAVLEQTTG